MFEGKKSKLRLPGIMTSGMNIKKILSMTDHTLLRVGCTQDEIDRLCDEAVEYHCAAVCVPPCYVSFAKDRIFGRNKVKVDVTVGFPNGYNTPEIKAAEAAEAKANGADEIDMVINVAYLKERNFKELQREISLVREAGRRLILKVIIETCLLTDDEKIAANCLTSLTPGSLRGNAIATPDLQRQFL